MIVIIDNGSQYTHLIKRNMRDLGQEAEILQNAVAKIAEIAAKKPEAIILSGGPSSVTLNKNGTAGEIVKMAGGPFGVLGEIPLLGICYGHQLLAHELGGKVEKGSSAEYGLGRIFVDKEDTLLAGVPHEFNAWVSHFDEVKKMPAEFICLAHSSTCKIEAMRHKERAIFGCQFHPEVWHTENGEKILGNFLSAI